MGNIRILMQSVLKENTHKENVIINVSHKYITCSIITKWTPVRLASNQETST